MSRNNRRVNDTKSNPVPETEGVNEMPETMIPEEEKVLEATAEIPKEIVPESKPKEEKKAGKKALNVKIPTAEAKKVEETAKQKAITDPNVIKVQNAINRYGAAVRNSGSAEIMDQFYQMIANTLDAKSEDGYELLLNHFLENKDLASVEVVLAGVNKLPPVRRRITASFYTVIYHLVKYKRDPKLYPFPLTTGGIEKTMSGTAYNLEKLFSFLHKHVKNLK